MSKTTIILDPQPDLWQPGSTIRWDDLAESRLVEHPGHSDQKTHGRRGGGGDMSALDAELRGIRGAERLVGMKGGKIVFDKGADGLAVDLEHSDDVKLQGSIASHNHPSGWDYPVGDIKHNGNGPSIPDLETAWRADVAEMRIVTPTRVISIKPGSDTTWGGGVQEKIRDGRTDSGYTAGEIAMHNALVDHDSAVRVDFMADINAGRKTIPQAEIMHADEVLHRAAADMGWKVTETRTADYIDPMNPPLAVSVFAKPREGPGGGGMPPMSGWKWDPSTESWAQTVGESIEQRVARQLVRYAVRLMEHPGHSSQKVHGRRGSVDVSGIQHGNLSAATKAKINARMEKLGMPSIDQMAEKIATDFKNASPEAIAEGMKWYEETHKAAADMAGEYGDGPGPRFGLDQEAAIIAHMSAQRSWESNMPTARELSRVVGQDKPFRPREGEPRNAPLDSNRTYKPSELTAHQLAYAHPELTNRAIATKYGISASMGQSHYKQMEVCTDVLRGTKTPSDILGGPKTRSFQNNIYDPTGNHVTVDDWAFKSALGDTRVTVTVPKEPRWETEGGGSTTTSQYEGPSTSTGTTATSTTDLTGTWSGPANEAPYGTIGQLATGSPSVTSESYSAGIYPAFAEAYSLAATSVGVLPQQVQAVVWVQARMDATPVPPASSSTSSA